MSDLHAIAHQFALSGKILAIEPVPQGLINDTFKVRTTCEATTLQRVNGRVFPKPEATVRNLLRVRPFIRQVVLPEPILTKTGNLGYWDPKGRFWRMLSWLDGTPLTEVDGQNVARLASGLGKLHMDLAAIDPDALEITLPHFHELDFYLDGYDRACQRQEPPAEFVQKITDFREEMLDLYRQLQKLPRRITHGDPKLDNVLLSEEGKIAWLDLDTLQPGWLWVDVADALRSLFSRLGRVDRELLALFLQHWLAQTKHLLTEEERRLLPASLWLISFELAVRFLNDFLEGGRTFKLSKEELTERARQQLQMAKELRRCCSLISKVLS